MGSHAGVGMEFAQFCTWICSHLPAFAGAVLSPEAMIVSPWNSDHSEIMLSQCFCPKPLASADPGGAESYRRGFGTRRPILNDCLFDDVIYACLILRRPQFHIVDCLYMHFIYFFEPMQNLQMQSYACICVDILGCTHILNHAHK